MSFIYNPWGEDPEVYMVVSRLDGQTLIRMLQKGAENLASHSSEIDALNVFPVPDGDTGANMLSTVTRGIQDLTDSGDYSVGSVSKTFSNGCLLGARGNSGVILSQIFKGIEDGLKDKEEVDAATLANAYKMGIRRSYSAVVKPVEGTILTVFREATEQASEKLDSSSTIDSFLSDHLKYAQDTLVKTKDMLDVLKKADVIDSGAAGYVCIAEGMLMALGDNPSSVKVREIAKTSTDLDLDAFTRDSVLEFGYCTEALLRLQNSKVDIPDFKEQTIVDYLQSIGGSSIVCFKTDDMIKLHVHLQDPGTVLTYLRKFGEFLTVKVENMSLQHEMTKAKELKELGVVAIANGKELKQAFIDMGCDVVVEGGQTSNPSAEDILKAIEEVPASTVILLPNNPNIVLSANQAASMSSRDVRVIPTRTLQEGYSCLCVYSPEAYSLEETVELMKDASSCVTSIEIARASKDALIDGISIRKGDYLGLRDSKKVLCAKASAKEALEAALDTVEDLDDKEVLTLFVGHDASLEQAEDLERSLRTNHESLDIKLMQAGQDVYDYLVSLE